MPLNASGNLSLAGSVSGESVALELGRAPFDEIALNDTDVRTLLAVPAGAVGMQTAYAKSRVLTSNIALTNNQLEFVLAPNVVSGYTAGTTAVRLTINSGVYVYSDNTARAGLTVTGFAAGDSISIVNNGFIIGKGGNGGAVSAGTAGGPAMRINNDITITNNSYIAGGGGGGAGNAGGGGGGAGGGIGGGGIGGSTGGAGGTVGAVGSNGQNSIVSGGGVGGGAGSGGGGFGVQSGVPRGAGGAGGGRILPGTGGVGGAAGVSAGTGGNGGAANAVGQQAEIVSGNMNAGCGGGGWGAAGGDGVVSGRTGGAGGASIESNNNAVYFVSTGTVYGAFSGNAILGNVTLSTNTTDYTFNPAKVTGYVAGKTRATLIVNSGVYLYATTTATPALTVSGWAAGDRVTIVNNGFIMGMGGQGGRGNEPPGSGTAGGPAVSLGFSCTIQNNSYIGGGGGGGGGTFVAGAGGGAGGGKGGGRSDDANQGGAGGGPGLSGANGNFNIGTSGSGGGGGRIMPGVGGAGGTNKQGGRGGGAGGGGAGYGGGATGFFAGAGGGAGNAGANAPGTGNSTEGYFGAGGGGWGAAGGRGMNSSGTPQNNFGAGGKAVNLNGFTVTWSPVGTRYGAIS